MDIIDYPNFWKDPNYLPLKTIKPLVDCHYLIWRLDPNAEKFFEESKDLDYTEVERHGFD